MTWNHIFLCLTARGVSMPAREGAVGLFLVGVDSYEIFGVAALAHDLDEAYELVDAHGLRLGLIFCERGVDRLVFIDIDPRGGLYGCLFLTLRQVHLQRGGKHECACHHEEDEQQEDDVGHRSHRKQRGHVELTF